MSADQSSGIKRKKTVGRQMGGGEFEAIKIF